MPKSRLRERKVEGINEGWTSHLGKRLYSIPGVESVYVLYEIDHLDVLILITRRDELVLEQISKVQIDFCEIFKPLEQSGTSFDFHIIYLNGSKKKDLVPDEAVLLPN
mgnify:CR=1 FL=1